MNIFDGRIRCRILIRTNISDLDPEGPKTSRSRFETLPASVVDPDSMGVLDPNPEGQK